MPNDKLVKMKQQQKKPTKKSGDSVSETISFVIKGKLTPIKNATSKTKQPDKTKNNPKPRLPVSKTMNKTIKARIKAENEDAEKKKTIAKLMKQANKVLEPVKRPKKVSPKIKPKNRKETKGGADDIVSTTASSDENNLEQVRQTLKRKKHATSSQKKHAPTKKRKIGQLLKFHTGPKRQRVASLNAIAKVHCLYENESRLAGLLDSPEGNLAFLNADYDGTDDEQEEEETPPQRNLRRAPGLRGAGKHWDMHDTSSSSSSSSSDEEDVKIEVKKEVDTNRKKRKRKQEIMMDLKDMVVQKRMASLNATAILAASYSQEKRTTPRSPKTEDVPAATETVEIVPPMKTEEKPAADLCTKTNNKKMAVILNRDTDVTITGVYVNSTTRSTHHEGYCSIAGMQYRISATSHTQTASTAVATTETLLQPAECADPPSSSASSWAASAAESYKPLDALSNMRPPSGGAGVGHRPVSSADGRRACASAFTAPHPAATYHHAPPPSHTEPAYIHGYYQPAGPLITVPVGHGQPPIAKNVPLSEISPTTPSPLSSTQHHNPAPSSNGDSSDSEVIITSVTAGKDATPAAPPPPLHTSYRYSQYPPNLHPSSYSYPYTSHYYHPTPPPPPPSNYPGPHDVCYSPSPYVHHKFPANAYRRYLTASTYYPPSPLPPPPPLPPTQDVYSVPPAHSIQQPSSQQMVAASPSAASTTPYQSSSLLEPPPPYSTALVETYPAHYYATYPPSSCYPPPPPRVVPFINGAAYQNCPCPMQSCPKNGLAGPLTGDNSKRSNALLPKSNMPPLPPVALALPKEPSSDGPPSPARGSAGMPPPPSPAGATYQSHVSPPTKCETISPPTNISLAADLPQPKRKARIGKAMVRSNMQMQQNTLLLMCNPTPRVKREIESPKENDVIQERTEVVKCVKEDFEPEPVETKNEAESRVLAPTDTLSAENKGKQESVNEILELEPIISTVGENVKVKNMKRKLSMSEDNQKIQKVEVSNTTTTNGGSYKNLIKKDANANGIVINNGKRKLIQEQKTQNRLRKKINAKLILIQAEEEDEEKEEKEEPAVEKTKAAAVSDARTKKIESAKRVTKKSCKTLPNRRKSRYCRDPHRKTASSLRWSNGWDWEGEPFEGKVFLNSDETTVVRKCYPSMRHHSGDLISVMDCVLLKAGARRNELPFVAKIAALWENPDDGEMMMSLLWYYRPEHTDQGRLPNDQPDEVFASRHKDSNSVACIDDKCYVLTFNEYCRYRKQLKRLEEGKQEEESPSIPISEPYLRNERQPPVDVKISPEMVFFCRRVYDFRQKRIIKNPT